MPAARLIHSDGPAQYWKPARLYVKLFAISSPLPGVLWNCALPPSTNVITVDGVATWPSRSDRSPPVPVPPPIVTDGPTAAPNTIPRRCSIDSRFASAARTAAGSGFGGGNGAGAGATAAAAPSAGTSAIGTDE